MGDIGYLFFTPLLKGSTMKNPLRGWVSLWSKQTRKPSQRRGMGQGNRKRSPVFLERLEDRTVPAVAFGVTSLNLLIRFDTTTPGTVTSTPITGTVGGEAINGID